MDETSEHVFPDAALAGDQDLGVACAGASRDLEQLTHGGASGDDGRFSNAGLAVVAFHGSALRIGSIGWRPVIAPLRTREHASVQMSTRHAARRSVPTARIRV